MSRTASVLCICAAYFSLGQTKDQNNPPQFLPGGDMRGFSLREDTPVGASVYTLKGSDPEGTDVTFSISGDYLSVDRNTGVVRLVKAIDREEVSSIETIITVTDARIFGKAPNTVPLRLDIRILDVNDNRPEFRGTPYAFRVSEDVSPGSTLFSDIFIFDADEGKNSATVLSCDFKETPEGCGLFDVREARVGDGSYIGVISLGASLDYEKRTYHLIKLKAEDGGGLISTASVEVFINDVQDQPPVLLNAPYSASVKEGSPPGSQILEIVARDGDLGDPQRVKLSIEGDDSRYFALSNVTRHEDATVTATLVTSQVTLDREDPIILDNGGIYTFYLRADEESGRRESVRSKVVIVVTDEDDQRPIFSASKTVVRVSENIADGTPLPGLDLVVSDDDIGENARFSLGLEDVFRSRGVFDVFPKNAVGRTPIIIKVINGSALDYENENANNFAFEVIAVQNGVAVAVALVNVEVSDANDNSPVFAYPSYRFSVEEGATANSTITTLTANDSDSGKFGKMTYSIKGFGAEKFHVNPVRGIISVGSCGGHSPCLDFEHQAVYSLTYSATDGGGRITSVNVFIDVLDVNDNVPVFDAVEYRRTVDEGTAFFDPPLVIRATDEDGKDQGGGRIAYSLQDGNTKDSAFLINASSGELLIRRALSHMDTPSSIYALTVRATDAGSPPLYNDVRVHITVGRDKNRPPRFDKRIYKTSIPENAVEGAKLISVKARDPDGSDSDILYHMGSKGGDHFAINATTGVIAVLKGAFLDKDTQPYHLLTVVAVDKGRTTQQSSSTLVNITVIDVNNKPPTFEQKSYFGHVNERSSIGDHVLKVVAFDSDEGAELVYNISEPIFAYDKTGVTLDRNSPFDFTSAFRINKTSGDVVVGGRLDHNKASVIVFNVVVTDTKAHPDYLPQDDTTEVTIYIQVFSDKNPIFPSPWTPTNPLLEMTLKEEQPLGEKVFSVAATDPISGRFVRRYEKIRNSDERNIFHVDPLTGEVTLNSKLDYERSQKKKETFEVLAIAGERTSQATVVVNIKDINDNSPQFTENEYHTRIFEDTRWPKTILTVTAVDADTEERGAVRYSLGGEDKVLFVINETTGEVQVARGSRLDRESTPTVNLEITASDTPGGGIMQRKTTVIVKIELTDVNDEVPKWTNRGDYTAVVAENAPMGTKITMVSATDPDLGINGVISYQIPELQELDGLFDVGSTSGIVTVKAPLNGKGRTAPYDLTIRAVDQGTPQQFSEAKLTLYIGDVSLNDGVPVFLRPRPNEVATVMENSRKGTAVFQVQAIDADSSETANGKIIYSFLESRTQQGTFQIDPSSGLITSHGSLDRESQQQYSIVVVAQDLGRPPQIASRVLIINVTDSDDNDPVFMKLSGKEFEELEIEEEAASGTVVGYVSALDRDTGPNAFVNYKITYGNEENLFGINRTEDNRGQIYVTGRIDREKTADFVLTVACGKLGHTIPDRIPYSSQDPSLLSVKIKVADLDDNRPEFEKEAVIAGIREDAPLQTEIVTLSAVDKDPTSLPIRYTLYNASVAELRDDHKISPEEAVNGSEIFLLEETTGIIRTKTSFRSYSSDIFTLHVAAASNPKDKLVLAKITIYVLRDSDLLRFVFNKNPTEIRRKIPEFLNDVQSVIPESEALTVYDTNYYDDQYGRIDYEKTGSCFQILGKSLDDTKQLLNSAKNPKLKRIFSRFNVSSIEPCHRRSSRASVDWVEIWVLVIAALIGLGAAFASCAICCLYSRYKKRIKRHTYGMRLLDSPQLVPISPQSVTPGSIVMLPPLPPLGETHIGPPLPYPAGNMPMLMGPIESTPFGPDWHERPLPIDSVSFSSIQR